MTELEQIKAERDKLQAFKDWVHAYLDRHGVPHHPPGTHGAEGCRIGDRMDWLMQRVGTEQQQFLAMLDRAGIGHGTRDDHDPPGTGVQVEHDEDGVTDWLFDKDGKLVGACICD